MSNSVTLFQQELEGGKTVVNVNEVAVCLKNNIEGCERSVFFNGESEKFGGPAVLHFSVKRAKDLLLEGCEYQGYEFAVETGGKKLPKLPNVAELKRIIEQPDTLIYVNDSPYKPFTEVFGFQQVYDDCFKCIDAIKKLGVPQEAMAIYATPEEISVEIHQDALGIASGAGLPEQYYRLLCHVADVKESNGLPVKTDIKTVVLQACDKNFRLLLPGSNHPTLHRTKVGVGPSHFAYGIAAFSDYCGKKRTLQECLQEALNWIKFLEKSPKLIEGLKDKIAAMPLLPMPGAMGASKAKKSGAGAAAFGGRFQSLKTELDGVGAVICALPKTHKTFSPVFDKSLGGGWAEGGLHVIVGPQESGKSALLLAQALICEKTMPVLCISYENSLREFVTRAAASVANINVSDMLSVITVAGGPGDFAKKSFASAVDKFHAQISQNIYFCGTDNELDSFDPASVWQLASMMPGDGHKMVLIDSLKMSDFGENFDEHMKALKNAALQSNLTIIMSVHTEAQPLKRPHYIEESDLTVLSKFQRYAASIVSINTEKLNLRRFVAMIKGQIDAALVGTLEQKALQLAGGKRYKNDSFTYLRVLHTRFGRRELILSLYQPDVLKFYELASLTLNRP